MLNWKAPGPDFVQWFWFRMVTQACAQTLRPPPPPLNIVWEEGGGGGGGEGRGVDFILIALSVPRLLTSMYDAID